MFILLLIILCIFFILYLKFKNYVPILMYHRIADIPGDRNALPKEKFAEQLEYLSTHNYHTITPEQLYNHFVNKTKLPKNPVLLTFDDGYQDNYLEALPLLKKYNMTAVVFPIYNWIGKPNKWENFGKQETTTMNLIELKSWLNHGLDIQPHTANHPFLTQCNEEKLKLEIIDTKTKFEKLLDKPMDYLCYPYGFFNQQQDAFLKFARMRSCPQTAPQIEAWLVKTCVRGAIDRLRRRRKRASFLSELSESGRLPAEDKSRDESGWSELLDDSAGEAAVRVARIKAGLNELPDGCRLILSLCLFEGYDYAEIAEITGLKTSSVRSQYTRAKGKLLEKLQRDG